MIIRLVLGLLLLGLPAQNETDFEFLIERARRALASGRLDEATARLDAAARLRSDDPALHFVRAELAEARNDGEGAVVAWRETIRLAPQEPDAYLRLAALQARMGRVQAALDAADELITRQPANPDAYRVAGQIAAEAGRLDIAEQRLRRLVELAPRSAEGWNLLGVVLASGPDKKAAAAAFEKALGLQADLVDAHYNLGLLEAERGRLETARERLEQAAGLEPGRADIHYALGTTYRRLGNRRAAEASLRQAVRLEPDDSQTLYALAGVLRETDRAEEARSLLSRYQQSSSAQVAVRERDSRVASLHSEVQAKLEANDITAAADLLPRIFEMDPENAFAFYRRGQIAFLRRDVESALADARRARSLQPADPAFANLEAMALARLGRVDEALAAYRTVIDLSGDPEAYIASAQLLGRAGRLSEGIALLEEAVGLQPGNRRLGSALVAALLASGNRTAAEKKRLELGLPPG